MPIEWKKFSKPSRPVDNSIDFPLITRSFYQENPAFFSDAVSDKKKFFEDGAILLVDKPVGWTSFDAVNKIRNLTKARRVGHCGTLDPFAGGLLIICTGRATKVVDRFSGLDKEYLTEFELGKITDTLDPEGQILEERPVPDISFDALKLTASSFKGEIDQVPPQFSAIKIKGIPSYKKARRGEPVEHQPRKIKIHSITIQTYSDHVVQMTIHCSKGTYVRALARDMGEKLGCGAIVKSLCRTAIGHFQLEQALSLAEITNYIRLQHVGG